MIAPINRHSSKMNLALVALFIVLLQPARASEVYAGKTIELIVANTVGGGYDQYGRIVARHFGRLIPGQPTLVVRNMPGAGGARAANYMATIPPRDGTVLAMLTREVALAPLLAPNPAAYQFKADQFNWIGSPQQDLGLLLLTDKAPAQTIEQLRTRPVVMSGTGPGSGPSTFPLVLNELLGFRMKVVPGYPGSQEALLAMENGEADGHVSGGSSAGFRGRINPMAAQGKLKVLMQLGMTKDPAYPEAPLIFDLVQDDRSRQLLELIFTPQYLGRPLIAPPGLAPERAALLRFAFNATMHDEAFLADARMQQLDIAPVTGEQIADVIKRVYSLPPELIERANQLGK